VPEIELITGEGDGRWELSMEGVAVVRVRFGETLGKVKEWLKEELKQRLAERDVAYDRIGIFLESEEFVDEEWKIYTLRFFVSSVESVSIKLGGSY